MYVQYFVKSWLKYDRVQSVHFIISLEFRIYDYLYLDNYYINTKKFGVPI